MSMMSNNDKDNELSLLNCFCGILRCHVKKSNYLIHFWQTWHQKVIQISEKDLLSYEQIHNKKRILKIIGSEIIFSIQTIEALLLYPCIPKRQSDFNKNDMKSNKVEMVSFKKNLDIDKVLVQKICKDIMSWKTIDDLKHSYFNKISFIDNNTIKNHLKAVLSEEAKDKLFCFILFSRESKKILQVSSNSISILNASDFSFTGKDLSDISIPNANLSWNNWIHVNFTNSDLSKVNFTGSNLNCCNFQKCIMTDVKFGVLYPNNPHSKPISIFAFSHDKNIIASWSLDKTIKIWDFKTNKVLHELKLVQNVKCFQFSPCDKILAFWWEEGIYLWNIEENYFRHYEISVDTIHQILFSKSGKHIIFSSESSKEEWIKINQVWQRKRLKPENKISILNIKELKEVSKALIKTYCMSLSNCGKLLICGCDHEILLLNLKLNILKKYYCDFQVKYVAFLPHCQNFIAYGACQVYLWNLKDCKSIKQIKLLDNDIKSFIASGDGYHFAFDTRSNNTLSFFLAENQNIAFRSTSHLSFIEQLTFTSVFNHIGGLFRNSGIKIWKLKKQNSSNFISHRAKITQISISKCGKYFASASSDRKIKLWGLNNFQLIKTLEGHKDIVYSIAFSSTKDVLVSSSKDGTLKEWSMINFNEIKTLITKININSLDFSSSGIYLAGYGSVAGYKNRAGFRSRIYIWNLKDEISHDITGNSSHESPQIYFLLNEDYVIINDNSGCQILYWDSDDVKYKFSGKWAIISISACRRYLALGSDSGKIALWSLYKNETVLDQFEPYEMAIVNAHKRRISALCFSSSGKYLASGSSDGDIKIWTINAENKLMNQIEEIAFGKHEVSSLAFSMCERFIISGYESGCIRVWDFERKYN